MLLHGVSLACFSHCFKFFIKISITHRSSLKSWLCSAWFQLSQLCSCVQLRRPTIPWTVSMGIYPVRELDFVSFPQNRLKWKTWSRASVEFSLHNPKYPAAVIHLLGLYRICDVLKNLVTWRIKSSFRASHLIKFIAYFQANCSCCIVLTALKVV